MINIHGKDYVTVAERLQKAGKDLIKVETEVLYTEPVVIKATITTTKGTFTGISAANGGKQIEKDSPYEVAETSAVGRALAFAGYETINGIASAEEMMKVEKTETYKKPIISTPTQPKIEGECAKCGAPLKWSENKQKWYCSKLCWNNPTPPKEIRKDNLVPEKDSALPF